LRENAVPLVRLEEVFRMGQGDAGADQQELFVVIINTGTRQVGFVVDELRGRQEVVIKPLEDYLQEKSGFSGATVLGDGSISLILDVFEMVQISLNQHSSKTKAIVS
jgi:two-component system chemotaxis sensor kinase CheA